MESRKAESRGGWTIFFGGLLLAALLPGCTAETERELRVGINAWPGYEFLFLAQEKGYYREEGVAVRLVEFNSLSDARRAFERGQIDGLGTTVIEVLQARDQSPRNPEVVGVVDYSNGADVILLRPEFRGGAGLKGRRVGVELGSLGTYVLARGLEKGGLGFRDVTAVSMDQVSMEEAFRKGEIDAAVTYPPTSIKLLRDAGAEVIFSTAEIPGEVLDVIAVDSSVIAARGAEVGRLLRAYYRALEYARTHPAEAYATMAARENLTAAEFGEALTNGVRVLGEPDQAAYLSPTGLLARVAVHSDRILREGGQVHGPSRLDGLANPRFLQGGARP